ncbi:MAG: nucleotidyltransferase [Candidatus Moranbacteria bacterium CG08_land_8_20_14_0_20_34_16]|nr:MAG: nucleotidyltransferase [Candidatus Moranbacteria bacterium CG08_land_8_20_14_0_20_34_16]
MAITITSSFQKLKENLEITGLQKSTASTRQENVRDVVSNDMDVLDSFLTGSYARSTMIAPLSEADIDIFIVLDPKYYESDGQASLLDKVKRALLKTYTKTPKISRNGQAVTITFTDFVVDVVPAFNRKGGGYLIPNSVQKTWIATNPKTHVDVMVQENKNHNGDLVPIVKMIKGWNKNINNDFVSFYLELLAIKIFKNVTISDFSSGMRFFFDKGREGIKSKVHDPVEYGGQINGLRNCKTVEATVGRFETAYNRAIKAEQYAKNGNIENAVDEWKKVFGDYFPAYG